MIIEPTSQPVIEKPSVFRKPVLRTLSKFRVGQLQLRLASGEVFVFGEDDSEEPASLVVKEEGFFKRCALYGGVGMGESYVDGEWETEDLRAVITWFIRNIAADEKLRGSSQRFRAVGLLRMVDRAYHWLRPNSIAKSRQNIAEHYDLGNEFYQLWLDPSMTYSSALFASVGQTLEEAQAAKYEALCRKLRLKASDHVLEIGCGWGGFCEYAASYYGCRITAVTISEAQHEFARRRMKDAGLEEKVDIRLQDYRKVTGTFDKIVSIEMLEAVGDRYLKPYFEKCEEILAPEGLLAIQIITVPDQRHAQLRRGTDFIQRHIFPGSLLLSVGRIGDVLDKTSDLALHEIQDMGASYARTLREWHESFNGALAKVREQGFSEAFVFKWNYYLKYCEAAFATRNISVVQAVYSRPNNPTLHREDGVNSAD